MDTLFARSEIADIIDKVQQGERLSADDGLRLFNTGDIAALGYAANLVREGKHGDNTTYIVNRYLHYSNVCWDTCKFCSFYRKPGEPGSFTKTVPDMVEWARQFEGQGVQELHIMGGLHPALKYDYYLDMLRGLKSVLPDTALKGFTSVEIDWFARIGRRDARTVMREMHEAGLSSLTGGGAEIFAEHIRKQICPNKISAERYFEIHGIAHEMGLKTQVTMLYGHIENAADRVDHLLRVRDFQDRTGGFQVFIPLAYHPENNAMSARRASGMTDLKVYAVSRLMLDNVPHIKCYWISAGLKLAQVSLGYGVDDLDGIVYEHERIFHDAGSGTPQRLGEDDVRKLISDAGRIPYRRDSRYQLLTETVATA